MKKILKNLLTSTTEYGIIKESQGTKKKCKKQKGEMNYGKCKKDSERDVCRTEGTG